MNIEDFRLTVATSGPSKQMTALPAPGARRRQMPFLKGPIPLHWLAVAGGLPGKALQVGVVLWFRAGMERSTTVSAPSKVLAEFGVDRFAKRRALDALAGVGLVAVVHRRGRNPVVTLLTPPEDFMAGKQIDPGADDRAHHDLATPLRSQA